MFSEYFEGFEVRPEYSKEFVSLWKEWLGSDIHYKLDEVTEKEWSRFNELLRSVSKDFAVEMADCQQQSLTKINDIESVLSSYEESLSKDASDFTRLVVSDLGCVISEDWDYTYIIWHKNNGAIETLSPYIKAASLESFHD